MTRERLESLPRVLLLGALPLLWALVFLPHARGNQLIFDDFEHLSDISRRSAAEILTHAMESKLRPVGFLLMKAEHSLWGWDEPRGYVAVSAALHCLNALLLVAVARRLGLGRSGAWLSGLLLLLASWVAEAVFAFSCQFDLLAVTLGLGGVLLADGALRRAGAPRAWRAMATVLVLLAALLAKEAAVFAPVLLLALPRPRPADRRAAVALCLAPVALYALVRVVELPLGATHYGNALELYAQGPLLQNLLRAPLALFGVPAVPVAGWVRLASAGGTLFLVVLAGAGVARGRPAAVLVATLAIAVAPVMWVGGGPAGRLLYAPVAVLAILLGAGWERLLAVDGPRSRAVLLLLATGLAYTVGLRGASLDRQRRDWTEAAALARSVLDQVGRELDTGQPLFIENLPMAFVDGGLVLQCRAFRDYYGAKGRRVPPIRCRGIALLRRPDGSHVPLQRPWLLSVQPGERSVVLDLGRR